MNFLTITWDLNPIWFSLGPIIIRYYSVLYVAGLIAAYFIINSLVVRDGKPRDFIDKLTWFSIIGLILGARIGHCLFYEGSYYISHPFEMIFPFKSLPQGGVKFIGYQGLSSHGGAIGILLAMYFFCRKYKVGFLWLADRLVFAVPLTGAFIRLGNFMNSEIIGKPTDLSWAIIFKQVDSQPRHPSMLYEALAYMAIFGFLIIYYRKNYPNLGNGKIFGWFLMLIFSSRILIEFTKEVQENFEQSMVLNMGQWLSLPFVAIGIWLLFYRKEKPIIITPKKK
jgi:phosphatidylglycerol---prolipoprotein diacylglyceryl transferase